MTPRERIEDLLGWLWLFFLIVLLLGVGWCSIVPTESLCGQVCEHDGGFHSMSWGTPGGRGSSGRPMRCHCANGRVHAVSGFERLSLFVDTSVDRKIEAQRDAARRAQQRFEQRRRDGREE